MSSSDYSARHLSVLEGLEAVRKRPGMYIGSTDSRGLMHCLWEIIDNSVDEALAGHGSRIELILHPDDSVEVRDTARGIPVDIEPKTGLSGVEVVFTKLHAGGKFGSGSYAASGGLHGVGASVVNALSERLDVEVDRDGKTWAMSFHRGEPGVFADQGPATPDAAFTPFEKGSELRVVGKVAKGVTGTRIRYWADPQIFTRGAEFQGDELLGRARQTAFLVPGLTLTIADNRGEEPVDTTFSYQGGISEFVDFLAPDSALTDTWRLTGEGHFTETVPVLSDSGAMMPTELRRDCEVDIALRWGTGYDTVMKSFVNIIATPKGGSHQLGFRVRVGRLVGLGARVHHDDPVERRDGRENAALLDHGPHVAEEEREQQGANVGAVDVRVAHDDDLAVARGCKVEASPGARPDHLDDGCALGVRQHVGDRRLLHVENLAADGQQRLVFAVARAPGGAERGIALDDEQLAAGDVAGSAVHELRRQG